MVASRDIRPGEVIFTEAGPLVAGPNHECPPVCLACLAPCAATRTCVCGYPVCAEECEAAHRDTEECRALARGPPPVFSKTDGADTKSEAGWSSIYICRVDNLLKISTSVSNQ